MNAITDPTIFSDMDATDVESVAKTVGDLRERAMLIDLSIGQWSAKKRAAKAAADGAKGTGAKASRITAQKRLVEKGGPLDACSQIAGEARAYLASVTTPWDAAHRLVAKTAIADVQIRLDEYQTKYETAARRFVDQFDQEREKARRELGEEFNELDYPDADRVARKFYFRRGWSAVPSANDLRVDASSGQAERIRAEAMAAAERQIDDIRANIAARIHDAVSRIVERMDAYQERLERQKANPDDKSKDGIFRDSLITNVRELLDALPILNVAGDEKIEDLRPMLARIGAQDPESLRNFSADRRTVKQDAEEALDMLSEFYNPEG